eukprot:180826-Hanusia_phi.AAC.11
MGADEGEGKGGKAGREGGVRGGAMKRLADRLQELLASNTEGEEEDERQSLEEERKRLAAKEQQMKRMGRELEAKLEEENLLQVRARPASCVRGR